VMMLEKTVALFSLWMEVERWREREREKRRIWGAGGETVDGRLGGAAGEREREGKGEGKGKGQREREGGRGKAEEIKRGRRSSSNRRGTDERDYSETRRSGVEKE